MKVLVTLNISVWNLHLSICKVKSMNIGIIFSFQADQKSPAS